jgi:hypothetical protein
MQMPTITCTIWVWPCRCPHVQYECGHADAHNYMYNMSVAMQTPTITCTIYTVYTCTCTYMVNEFSWRFLIQFACFILELRLLNLINWIKFGSYILCIDIINSDVLYFNFCHNFFGVIQDITSICLGRVLLLIKTSNMRHCQNIYDFWVPWHQIHNVPFFVYKIHNIHVHMTTNK